MLVLLAGIGAPANSHAQFAEWTGATDSDWNTASNWVSAIPVDFDSVLIGVNSAVTNTTIDLGGTTSANLYGDPTVFNKYGYSDAYMDGRVTPLRFGNVGGETEYTIQNGTIFTDVSDSLVWIGDDLTVNWNVNSTGSGAFMQVGANSTLNIGPGVTSEGRFSVYNGGANDTLATVNLNAENYAVNQPWIIGSGNAGTSSTLRAGKSLDLNINADQTIGQYIIVGHTYGEALSTVIIRNGAEVVCTSGVNVGNTTYTDPLLTGFEAKIQIGDETSTGYLQAHGFRLQLGGGSWSAGFGSTGIVDIVNGELFLDDGSTVPLGFGRFEPQEKSTGVINVYANGLLRTRSNFEERVIADAAFTGTGIMNFDGGTLQVDDGGEVDELSNLIGAGVEVNIMDGGMVFQISAPSAGVTPGDFNGDTTVNIADYTVWRNNLGADESELFAGTGDNSTVVDTGDYDLWKMHFGETGGGAEIVGSATIQAPLLGTGTGGLTVQGGGELILNGANTYVGDTIIDGSTLSIAIASLADGADVELLGDAILDLSFGGTDTVDQLLFDGVAQATGTWGALGSGADFEDARITGSGLLMVTTAANSLASVTAVPEPSTAIGAIVLAVSLVGFGLRRPQ
nr:hypothetical protein [Aeoliella straminimaris]